MLGHGYWQRRFRWRSGRRRAANPSRWHLARDYRCPAAGLLVHGRAARSSVLPLRFDRAKVRLAGYNFRAVGRLRPGVSIAAMDADVARIIRIELGKFPPPPGMGVKMMEDTRLGPNVRPLIDNLVGDVGKSLWVVMATIGIVLLIACANVANLLLVRTEGPRQELAVRAAIGAGRRRLAREMLVESLLLGPPGRHCQSGVRGRRRQDGPAHDARPLPRLELIGIDATSLVFTLVLSVFAGLAFQGPFRC